ncbi:hypothetical protein [Pontibacter brevis]
MKTTGVHILKRLSLLLAILLGSVLAFAAPVAAKAAPTPEPAKEANVHATDDAPFIIAAGEVSAGESEGILQKSERTLWTPLSKAFLQLIYPQALHAEAIPACYPFHSGTILQHSILTKGP